MALTVAQKPLAEVTGALSAKTPIGSVLRSAEWANVPVQLRETAFFSAAVESARALTEAQAGLRKILELARDEKGAVANRSKWIADMQQLANSLGLRNPDPNKRGGLQDFGSERRLKAIFEQQIGGAQSKAYYLSGQDPDILDAWPAQELVRLRASKAPRDWPRRWADAGGKFYGGRMIALKTDPIWTRISRFERPWPPFDYGSGMGLEEIDREEAESLGLIRPGEAITPSVQRDLDEMKASAKGLDPAMRKALDHAFGDQIEISGDHMVWKQQKQRGRLESPANTKPIGAVTAPASGRGLAAEPERPTVEESRHINEPVEIVTVYGPDDEAREILRGTKKDLDLGRERVERGDFTDTTITHNHPAGNSFSDSDLGVAASADLAELRIVCGKKGGGATLYRLLRPARGWPHAPLFIQAHKDAAAVVEYRQKNARLSSAERRRRFAHEVMLELQRTLGDAIDYRVIEL